MTPGIIKPEFCPNPLCRFYDPARAASANWYIGFGRYYTLCRGWIKRFRCRSCGKTCSTQTFSIHYWTHSTSDFLWISQMLTSSSALRQMARFCGHTYRVIQNRVRRLARNSLSVMDCVFCEESLSEDLAMDGFESYTRSQYHPNNFTCIVGTDSQFFYSVVHTLFRRKGAMSEHQKHIRSLIDCLWRPPERALIHDCSSMLKDLTPMITSAIEEHGPLTLFTDRHRAYPQALKQVSELDELIDSSRLIHQRISSRISRTVTNPLFPVNYLDRQIRKNMGEHVRETVKQGREVNSQMERMAVFMYTHNFLTPHRIDDDADVSDAPVHADKAGIVSDQIQMMMRRYMINRHIWGHRKCKHEWMRWIWHHQYENPPSIREKSKLKEVWVRRVALPPGRLPAHFLA